MLKSLYSGVSGIQTHQLKMDVIGNNIANVNTIGYKRGDVVFQELLNQTISGAAAPTSETGGTNPIQIGLGVKVGSITNQFTQGNLQYTGSNTDMAIEGNGFFVVADGSNNYYTRSGSFVLDKDGNLVHSANGSILQGWVADDNGNINISGPISGIQVPIGKTIPAKSTENIRFEQNIDARTNGTLSYQPSPIVVTDAGGEQIQVSISLRNTGNFNEWAYEISATGTGGSTVSSVSNSTGVIKLDKDGKVLSSGADIVINLSSGESVTLAAPAAGSISGGKFEVTSAGDSASSSMNGVFEAAQVFENTVQVYDSLGGVHNLKMNFTKVGDNQWMWQASSSDADITVTGSGYINYDSASGKFVSASQDKISVNYGSGIGIIEIAPDFSKSTQFSSNSSMLATNQDGYANGYLKNFSIDQFGCVNGVFSNGVIKKMAQVALASFSNPSGLSKVEGSFFCESNNSGVAYIGTSGTGGRGQLISGNLETSNVDLSKEFTDLITTQRGYQASAKVITTSDELLQELINIKR